MALTIPLISDITPTVGSGGTFIIAGERIVVNNNGTITTLASDTPFFDSLGFSSEAQAAVNYLKQSNEFATTWSTVGTITRNKNATGPDGVANSAWTINDTSGATSGAVHQNTLAVQGGLWWFTSFYFERTVGIPTNYPVLLANAFGNLAGVVIDTQAGTAKLITEFPAFVIIPAKILVTNHGDWFRVTLGFVPHITTAYTIALYPAGKSTYLETGGTDNAATGSCIVWQADCTAYGMSSPIISTTTNPTRPPTKLSYPTTDNLQTGLMHGSFDWSPESTTGTQWLWGSYTSAAAQIGIFYDGTSLIFRKRTSSINYEAFKPLAAVRGQTYHIDWWVNSDNTIDCAIDGVPGNGSANTTAISLGATVEIGSDGNGANGLNGHLKSVAIEFTANSNYTEFPLVILGDSTIAEYLSYSAVAGYLIKSNGWRPKVTSVAVPGETIAQQQTRWTALSAGVRSATRVVVVQVGLNDTNFAESAATALGRYQTLINTIAADAPSARIYTATMSPCKQRLIDLYGATDGATAYQKWLDMNEGMTGSGANAITGMYGTITAHTASLNDGSGNLAATYDSGDHIHENNAGRKVIGDSWSAKLTTDGSWTLAASQTITFGALSATTYGAAPITLTATASSGLPVSYASSDTDVATVDGNTVTIVGVGTTNITASQAGDETYAAATPVVQALTVAKADQTISISAPRYKLSTDAPFAVSATASSGLTCTLSILSGPATILNGTVTLTGTLGDVVIRAVQAGNGNYNAAATAERTVHVVDVIPQTAGRFGFGFGFNF